MKISATVILGIGGTKYTKEHIIDTANIINNTTINYLSTLQLGIEEDAKDNFYKHFSNFTPLDDSQILDEQKRFLELLDLPIKSSSVQTMHQTHFIYLEHSQKIQINF